MGNHVKKTETDSFNVPLSKFFGWITDLTDRYSDPNICYGEKPSCPQPVRDLSRQIDRSRNFNPQGQPGRSSMFKDSTRFHLSPKGQQDVRPLFSQPQSSTVDSSGRGDAMVFATRNVPRDDLASIKEIPPLCTWYTENGCSSGQSPHFVKSLKLYLDVWW